MRRATRRLAGRNHPKWCPMSSVIDSEVLTIGQICRHLDVPLHRVEYVINSRSILPCGRVGNCRLFRQADVERIAQALASIERKKGVDDAV